MSHDKLLEQIRESERQIGYAMAIIDLQIALQNVIECYPALQPLMVGIDEAMMVSKKIHELNNFTPNPKDK